MSEATDVQAGIVQAKEESDRGIAVLQEAADQAAQTKARIIAVAKEIKKLGMELIGCSNSLTLDVGALALQAKGEFDTAAQTIAGLRQESTHPKSEEAAGAYTEAGSKAKEMAGAAQLAANGDGGLAESIGALADIADKLYDVGSGYLDTYLTPESPHVGEINAAKRAGDEAGQEWSNAIG